MLNTPRARNGMVTAPHHLASEAGKQVLRDGGTAVEAGVAMAAALAVVYPHMTSIGGDAFWLIQEPGRDPIAIEACGGAGNGVDLDLYRRAGLSEVPWRGPLAAITVAGTVGGWDAALQVSRSWQEPMALARILRDPISYAEDGIPVTRSQEELTRAKVQELRGVPGFADTYLAEGEPLAEGTLFKQPALGVTLRRLATDGLDTFYRGELARCIAADLERAGSPLTLGDLERQQSNRVAPLTVRVDGAQLWNFPPPTQGVASLMILALFDRLRGRLGVREGEGFAHVHGLVEATKQAFLVRDREVGDPAYMRAPAQSFLDDGLLDELAARIDPARALPWPQPASTGDTVWFGAIDGQGRAVSLIQSIYHEYGSGIVLPESGIVWQNRGCSFRLAEDGWNALKPGRKPFHTLNPAMARFDDGRRMVYGTMGGEGQPQTQAAVFTRYARFGQSLQAAVTAPRWLLGRAWGDSSVSLKLENRFDPAVVAALRAAGHDVEIVEPFSSMMGHAGAIVLRPDGVLEGATDPRSDGAVGCW